MKFTTALLTSAVCYGAIAQPVFDERDEIVAIFTVVETVVVTTDVTVMIGSSPPPVAKNTQHANHIAYHAQGNAVAKAQPSPPVTTSSTSQSTSAQQTAPPISPSSGSSPEQIQAAEDQSQESANQRQEDINNKQQQANLAHQSQMIQLQNGGSAPVVPSPTGPIQSPTPPIQATSPPPSGGSGGSCGSVGGACSGDVTIYNDQGIGACGWTNDTNSEDFFALAHAAFGSYTNDAPGTHKNRNCGRMATIQVNGKSFTGMLTDKCGGCDGNSIDLSQHLFSQLYPDEPAGNGRFHNVPWHFTSESVYAEA